MTFEMVRFGWPNAVAVAALAILPLVALATAGDRRPAAAPVQVAVICPAPADCPALATFTADTIAE